MVPPLPRDPRVPEGVILVGPGPRARELGLALAGLAAERGVETRAFEDVAELGLETGRGALLLLDVDATPVEDAGYVRRFLVAHPEVELVAFGADARARTVRVLGARRFASWPPDLDELAEFVLLACRGAQSAKRSTSIGSSPPAPSPSSPAPLVASGFDSAELDEVRSILDGDDESPAARVAPRVEPESTPSRTRPATPAAFPDDFAPSAPRSRAASHDAAFADATDLDVEDLPRANAYDDDHGRGAELGTPRTITHVDGHELGLDLDAHPDADPSAPRPAIDAPPWWRAQVADLADASQRIDLSLKMLAQSAPDIDEGQAAEAQTRLRELEAEVARLLQFTRTLGYVAAPPPAGTQTFDLGEIVHLFAANLAQSGPEAPRCQFKAARAATVRSDRQLVSQTLDALFFLVRCTSRKGDLVRAQVASTDDARGAGVELTIDFPSGPLEGFGADDVITPYGLADLFPELGPNALAAAAGIVAGQGGSLALVNRARARMTWTLWMPRAS